MKTNVWCGKARLGKEGCIYNVIRKLPTIKFTSLVMVVTQLKILKAHQNSHHASLYHLTVSPQ